MKKKELSLVQLNIQKCKKYIFAMIQFIIMQKYY